MTKRDYGVVIAARIPADLKEKLIFKHPNNGDLSRLIHCLLEKYLQGKILGIHIRKEKKNNEV